MAAASPETDLRKTQAAEYALKLVEPGMRLGLGTGSTAAAFIDALGARVREGLEVRCVATSSATEAQAGALGIPLSPLDTLGELDLTVDGADEIDPALNLVKGGGGALLREKIVAMASQRVVIIADDSKLVERLGPFPLPIEVEPFGAHFTLGMIEIIGREAGCHGEVSLRTSTDGLFRTDGGHYIADCAFGAIPDPALLGDMLTMAPGVIEHGLFIGIADAALIAGADGVRVIEAANDET
ncbi:MAG: ribose-5-phosphate isomerase RpiA [Alphaproteobacteria bacterium]|jgi:ribose 5-phosphate isomerase A|nr:ribose-5-phosphate isomerase RpiA [Alphaproteobacteria bacterium]